MSCLWKNKVCLAKIRQAIHSSCMPLMMKMRHQGQLQLPVACLQAKVHQQSTLPEEQMQLSLLTCFAALSRRYPLLVFHPARPPPPLSTPLLAESQTTICKCTFASTSSDAGEDVFVHTGSRHACIPAPSTQCTLNDELSSCACTVFKLARQLVGAGWSRWYVHAHSLATVLVAAGTAC